MNVSLPPTWEQFVANQVRAGEYGNASEVVRDALRLLREQQEARAQQELRSAFAGVDPHGGQGEPSPEDRERIAKAIRGHRQARAGA